MDVLTDDVAVLDGPLLAALWVRSVLAGDPVVVAACEMEAEQRGTTCRALVAASKKKDDEEFSHTDFGKKSKGPSSQEDIVTQAQKNKREGKKWDTGQATYKESKGYNPYRKKKGEKGGGQFTTKEAAQTTNPDAARDGAELEEDDKRIPDKSPGGAEIDDFRDGMMIYKDGTRYDAQGWRNEKGEALDANGKVIKKDSGKAGAKAGQAKVEAARRKAEADAERARKKQEQEVSRAWDTAEARRAANDKAAKGDYGSLLSIVERNERDARKKRDLGTGSDDEVAAAQKELADTKAAAEKAKTEKDAAAKTERETKSTAAKAERETKSEADRTAKQTAEYAKIAKNYAGWESELRARYADVGLSEAELADLVIRDRARRIRLLPRKRRYVSTPVAAALTAASGFDGAVLALLVAGNDTYAYDDGDEAPLHCTICFLGPASELTPVQKQRCVDMAKRIGEDFAPFDANVVSPAQFGDTPVGLLEAPALNDIRDAALADGTIGALRAANDEHPGYLPHVSGLDDRDSVRFDRVAAMLGGDTTEFPLSGSLETLNKPEGEP